MTDVWIVVIQTRQMDTRIGAVFPTREQAEAECAQLEKNQGRLEVNNCFIEHRQVVLETKVKLTSEVGG